MRSPVISLSAWLAGAGAFALAGCATSVSGSAEAADAEATAATGIVVVEGTRDPSSPGDGNRSDAVARFVRARTGAVDDDALRMVGAAVDFPPVGSCEALAPVPVSASPKVITLLDVGGVTLLAGESATSLQPRLVPDVADLVSGVVYSARADELPSRSPYVLRVEGSADLDVAPFILHATSPGEPLDVRVGSDDGRAGAVVLPSSPAGRARPVDVTWEAGTGEDAIYIDVSAAGSPPSSRCLFDDSGHAPLPASALGSIEEGTLAVHRLHREAFHARGVEPGEVRFDFARVVSFTRR